MLIKKIQCVTHGEALWNGEAVCDCGRPHLLSLTISEEERSVSFEWSCDCGRQDPVESLNPVCPACFRAISGIEYYGPS